MDPELVPYLLENFFRRSQLRWIGNAGNKFDQPKPNVVAGGGVKVDRQLNRRSRSSESNLLNGT